jgi:hypothetical protein
MQAGEYTPGVDYEHEHRVTEHEHESRRTRMSILRNRIVPVG